MRYFDAASADPTHRTAGVPIAIITGAGTGKELSAIFVNALSTVCASRGEQVSFVHYPRVVDTYHSIRRLSPLEIESRVASQVDELFEFLAKFAQAGGRAVFRTAINAEILYRLRMRGQTVKEILFHRDGRRILIIRDQLQGYYANEDMQVGPSRVTFAGSFSKESLELVFKYAFERARSEFSPGFEAWAVYKFHLFANVFENWMRTDWPGIRWAQPNHATEVMYDNIKRGFSRDVLVIVGNEAGDILHEVSIFAFGAGRRSTLCSKCVYLSRRMRGLTEYQTVHGSVDELAGTDTVNPEATLRAVGELGRDVFGWRDLPAKFERGIKDAHEGGFKTPDLGGRKGSNEVAERVLSRVV